MAKPDTSINPRLLEAAKKAFLACGYEKASTNTICKNAGVTWGALSKRYAGKDELFCALASPVADEFKEMLNGRHDRFHAQSHQEQEAAALSTSPDTFFIDYVYQHFDVFKLLIGCAKGSSCENYLDELVDILVAATTRFMEETGCQAIIQGRKAAPQTIHILISSYLYGLFEPVLHDMSRDEAIIYTQQLEYFFNIGWADILRLE